MEEAKNTFGLTQTQVIKSNEFFKKNHNLKFEKFNDYLELRKPYKISKNFYLMKIGMPYIKQNLKKTSSNVMEIDDNESEEQGISPEEGELCYNNGFVSLKLQKSCINAEMLVYYYQSVMYIKEVNQTVFIIIPADN